jgi:CSLREA domain-containing protein
MLDSMRRLLRLAHRAAPSARARLGKGALALLCATVWTIGIVPSESAYAATYIVNSTADAVDADLSDGVCATTSGACTLRAAIQQANSRTNADVISLPAGTFALTIGTPGPFATEGRNEDAAATGDLDITAKVTITGAGAAATIVDGSELDRVFDVIDATVAINELSIQNGLADDVPERGIDSAGDGGGIRNTGRLTLSGTAVTGNRAASGRFSRGAGGGIFSNGTLVISRSTISGNGAGVGGGIASRSAGSSVTLTDVILDSNTDSGCAGGICNLWQCFTPTCGTLTLLRVTLSRNHSANDYFHSPGAAGGLGWAGPVTINDSAITQNSVRASGTGGIQTSGALTLANSTVAGNQSAAGVGGVLVGGIARLNNVTIAANVAGPNAGMDLDIVRTGGIGVGPGATASVGNTLIGGNRQEFPGPDPTNDCSGTLASRGYNLLQDPAGCTLAGSTAGKLLGLDPLLGPLQDNGGPTLTRALLATSPAIDAGSPPKPGAGSAACTKSDQRGVARPLDGDGNSTAVCDIGAFEAPRREGSGGENLIRNPSFEKDLQGWYGFQSQLSRVKGGHGGGRAARVALSCLPSATCDFYTMDDSPATEASPPQGATYAATAWVRADTSVGKLSRVVIRESGGATPSQFSAGAPVTLTGDWQKVTVAHVVARADRTSLEVYVSQLSAADGDAFLVDDVSLVRQS